MIGRMLNEGAKLVRTSRELVKQSQGGGQGSHSDNKDQSVLGRERRTDRSYAQGEMWRGKCDPEREKKIMRNGNRRTSQEKEGVSKKA